VAQRGYSTSSEYVRELIRKDQDRLRCAACCWKGPRQSRQAPSTRTTSSIQNTCSSARPSNDPAKARRKAVKAKPVVPRALARRDVEEAIDHYPSHERRAAALGFVDALEQAYRHIGRYPAFRLAALCA
jgi:hypothetical protein